MNVTNMRARWAWGQVNKNGTGEITLGDMARLELRYNEQVATSGDIFMLIKKVDINHDMNLDETEIAELLEVCGTCKFFDCP
jgi:hypothetical protein